MRNCALCGFAFACFDQKQSSSNRALAHHHSDDEHTWPLPSGLCHSNSHIYAYTLFMTTGTRQLLLPSALCGRTQPLGLLCLPLPRPIPHARPPPTPTPPRPATPPATSRPPPKYHRQNYDKPSMGYDYRRSALLPNTALAVAVGVVSYQHIKLVYVSLLLLP